jgi:hypothetical protein
MAETYDHYLVTIDEVGGCAVSHIVNGIISSGDEAQGATFEFLRVSLDLDNNIVKGFSADGSQRIFEPGAELSVSLVNAAP